MDNALATAESVDLILIPPETKERIRTTILNSPKLEDECLVFQVPLYFYQGFWMNKDYLEGDILAHEFFKAQPSDIFICSFPKSGTTWLKALTFAIVTRTRYDNNSPLLDKVPHDCMPFLAHMAKKADIREPGLPLISTHVPYSFLPKSTVDLDCKVVYICRDPKDVFVSLYHQIARCSRSPTNQVPMEKVFDHFCQGNSYYGPYWDHILGFWKASQEKPEKVLFLKYEDILHDTVTYVKKLAEFMGYPFSLEEDKQGAVQKIVELCSFENMSNLAVNKIGLWESIKFRVENKTFFRKAKVGDWKNFLSPEMARRLDEKTEQMLSGSGLTFQYEVPS